MKGKMRLFVPLSFCLLVLCCSSTDSREITHEDIKDAMLSLVHMMRENTEKLERHEVRERQLGEQMKKAIGLLSKRISAVDGLKTHLSKLDDKIVGIEQLISQRDERERVQLQKALDSLESLEHRLENWQADIGSKLSEVQDRHTDVPPQPLVPKSDKSSETVLAQLNKTEAMISGRLAKLEFDLDSMSNKMTQEATSQRQTVESIANQVNAVRSQMNDVQNGLVTMGEQNYQLTKEIAEKLIPDPGPAIQEQHRSLKDLRKILDSTSGRLEQMPTFAEMESLHNKSDGVLEDVRNLVGNVVLPGIADMGETIARSKDDTQNSLQNIQLSLEKNAGQVNQELEDLGKGQSVMVSMADHVLDTKKRVEYGVHQILLEVGDLVKAQGNNINDTLNTRFDGISNDIMDNQNGAVANLTTKMEQEMNQVWRQINVMYQQMTESAKALDKIHKQNEAYVNGTTSTMDGMESKVGEITQRMSEVDENLNYLLGRLSLVTQEFNQIKSGLGAALDNIKASFKEVQEKANDLGSPGPHPVPQNYKELDDGDIQDHQDNGLRGEDRNKPRTISDIKSY